jgi:octopine/nopaline transport system permease protein
MAGRVQEKAGIAMEFGLWQVWEGGWIGAILRGAVVTIAIGVASMIFGLVIGIICGLIRWRAIFGLSLLVDLYTSVIRGVPELLIIYMLFFGSVEFVTRIATAFGFGALADAGYVFFITVAAISAISGAYSTEVIRGALAAIPNGHIEAAVALGLSSRRIFARIIAPQMMRIAFPGINNVWQTTIKDTALVSVVGLQELMRTAFIGAGSTRSPLIFYAIAAVVYLSITLISQVGFNKVEAALSQRKGA